VLRIMAQEPCRSIGAGWSTDTVRHDLHVRMDLKEAASSFRPIHAVTPPAWPWACSGSPHRRCPRRACRHSRHALRLGTQQSRLPIKGVSSRAATTR
jgi:hypothetical protein